ncbi:MAG: L-fuculokinase [Parvibaculaceae bacterium]
MSYLGIDVGTSALKAGVYREDGRLLGSSRIPVTVQRRHPHYEELDPHDVWQAFLHSIAALNAIDLVRKDPIQALAISASADEVFPVDGNGDSLFNCILSGDGRGADVEADTRSRRSSDSWFRLCGHMPERFDPANRILWLARNAPDAMSRAMRLVGWHEFLVLRLTGRAITDLSLAAKWALFDSPSRCWDAARIAEFRIDPELLPEIMSWQMVAGEVGAEAAERTGLPKGTLVCVGGFDGAVAALGAGVTEQRTAGLACGTWQNIVAPIARDRAIAFDGTVSGVFRIPYPGGPHDAVGTQNPNGAGVAAWASAFLNLPLDRVGPLLDAAGPEPSPVLAIPHLSGTVSAWRSARESRGAFIGLSFSNKPEDAIQATMEAVAYELALTTAMLHKVGIPLDTLWATGGGTRSSFWMQLKSDLTDIPIRISDQPEPGTFGAALLAMSAATHARSAADLSRAFAQVRCSYEPNAQRRALHAERLARYAALVDVLAPHTKEA